MLVSTKWLLEYLEPAPSVDELLDALPKVGLEIEELDAGAGGTERVVDLNVLPNRPDCLGVIGIAREVAALLGLQLRYREPPAAAPAPGEPVPVEVLEEELCPRYLCQLIRGVRVKDSPPWLKARLAAVGLRPINNVVDVTNYVLREWGQPLHAFDYRKLRGGRIVVRLMKAGETLELLSGKVIDAAQTPLVIADAERPIALAGVMGGRATETGAGTADVLLEAACFDPVNIRGTVRKIDVGLESRGTESSYRFERGTDPNRMLEGALRRASALIVELGGGRLAGPAADCYPTRRGPRVFRLDRETLCGYLGLEVDAPTVRDCLERLEMQCSDDLEVTVPTWRADVSDPVVLIEDVARLVGYDRVPMKPGIATPTVGQRATPDRLREAVAQHLVAAGFLECRNLPLEAAETVSQPAAGEPDLRIAVSNPLSKEMSVLRSSLLTGLLASVDRNVRRGAIWARLFEIDRVFALTKPGGDPGERWRAAGIVGGPVEESHWRQGGADFDFYATKGVVENLLSAVGVRHYRFQPASVAPYVPGTAAEVSAGTATLGHVGELPRELVDRSPFRLFAFELDLEALEPSFTEAPAARALVRTPAVTRDLAIVVRQDHAFAEIESAIRAAAGALLETLRLVDVYEGRQVPSGHKSLALHLAFRDPAGTLTADSVSATMQSVVASLEQRFGAQLRA